MTRLHARVDRMSVRHPASSPFRYDRHRRFAWLAGLLVALACTSGVFAQASTAANAPMGPTTTWTGVYESYPLIIRLDIALPDDMGKSWQEPHASLTLAPLPGQRSNMRPPQGSTSASVEYDAGTGILKIKPSPDAYRELGVEVPSFIGVYDAASQTIGGVLGDNRSSRTPYFVIARGVAADDRILRPMRTSFGNTARSALSRYNPLSRITHAFGGMGSGPVHGGEAGLYRWVAQLTNEYAGRDMSRMPMGELWQLASCLFRDKYFVPYFGKPFDRLTGSEVQQVRNTLIRLRPSSRDPAAQSQFQLLRSLANAFFAGPNGFTFREFLIATMAQRPIAAWHQQALQRLQNVPADPSGWKAIADAESAAHVTQVAFLPSERGALTTAIAAARSRVATPSLTALVQQLDASAHTYADMTRVSAAIATLTNPPAQSDLTLTIEGLAPLATPDLRRQLVARLDARRTALAGAVVKSQAGSATGAQGLNELRRLETSLSGQFGTSGSPPGGATPTAVTALHARIHELAAQLAATETQHYEAFEGPARAKGLAGLSAAVQRESALATTYGTSLYMPEFTAFNALRAKFRQELIAHNSRTLVDAVTRAKSTADISAFLDAHVLYTDRSTTAASPIMAAVQRRASTLAPFAAFPGGDYLDAIYNNDPTALKQLDTKYIGHVLDMMRNNLSSMGPIGQRLANMYSQQNTSLVPAVLVTYMKDYQDVYHACLRPDARKAVVTTTVPGSEMVNGRGEVVSASPGYTTTHTYLVNPEFLAAFNDLGTNEPSSGAFLDVLMNHGLTTQLLTGVGTVMSHFRCTDPRIKRLEHNMLKLYRTQ